MSRVTVELDVLEPESCDDCGLCCEGIGSPVTLYASRPDLSGPHPHRPPGLPEMLIREIDEHFLGLHRGQEPQEGCLWFDPQARRCKHYEWRPTICRDYKRGGEACLRERRRHLKSTAANTGEHTAQDE